MEFQKFSRGDTPGPPSRIGKVQRWQPYAAGAPAGDATFVISAPCGPCAENPTQATAWPMPTGIVLLPMALGLAHVRHFLSLLSIQLIRH